MAGLNGDLAHLINKPAQGPALGGRRAFGTREHGESRVGQRLLRRIGEGQRPAAPLIPQRQGLTGDQQRAKRVETLHISGVELKRAVGLRQAGDHGFQRLGPISHPITGQHKTRAIGPVSEMHRTRLSVLRRRGHCRPLSAAFTLSAEPIPLIRPVERSNAVP